jgi:hypothetical protein
MERETGIEPATNSLEGCDSTTELLPPSRRAFRSASTLRRGRPLLAPLCSCPNRPLVPGLPNRSLPSLSLGRLAEHAIASARRRLVAREGLEPSKPLGRQIYSLLRLTAPQPRQLLFGVFDVVFVLIRPVELAEGFEPPTG